MELLGGLNLRPTLDRAAAVGELLAEARTLLPHGSWLPWLRRCGLNERTARDYVTVAREMADRRPAADMGIRQFLEWVRRARYEQRRRDREAEREAVADRGGRLPDRVQLHRADCRRFDWPPVDVIATDPPWSDMAAYSWLAGFAAGYLADGGLLLVQCGVAFLPTVMGMFSGVGLSYVWTLAVVFSEARNIRANGGFRSGWKPVLVYSRGERTRRESVSDTYTVRTTAKEHHDWEQPAGPWRYWLSRMAPAGSLIADPFAGSGTTGVVCSELGYRWIGTERDPRAYRVARGRLSQGE